MSVALSELLDLSNLGHMSFDDKVIYAHTLDELLTSVHYVRDQVGEALYDEWPIDDDTGQPRSFVAVQGTDPLVRETGGKRKQWQPDELRKVLAAQVADEMFDTETGERLPAHAIVARSMEVLADVFGITAGAPWRVGKLKARNIDPSEFCSYEPGNRKAVRFVPPDRQPQREAS